MSGVLQKSDDGKVTNKDNDSSNDGRREVRVITDTDLVLEHYPINKYSKAHVITGDPVYFFCPVLVL